MQQEHGFSLVEILISIFLIGLIALIASAPMFNNHYYRRNVAETLAESAIESCRNIGYSVTNKIATSTIETQGLNVTYTIQTTVTGYDINNISFGNTYHQNTILVNPAISTDPLVKKVSVKVTANNLILAERSLLIPKP